jgi:hypothetical protein
MVFNYTFIFGLLTGMSLLPSFILDRDKIFLFLKKGEKMLFNILHPFLNILILISIVLFFIPDYLIVNYLGANFENANITTIVYIRRISYGKKSSKMILPTVSLN